MIGLDNISKSFGTVAALTSLSLTVPHGKTTVLIGPSGCGKSTLVRVIAGLVPPDSGRVFVGGQELTPGTVLEVRRRIGYVIQQGGLFPHLTARANITLMASYIGWSQPDIERRLRTLTELTKFPDAALERFPVQLSGGQNQRVSLMRALMLDPGFLLLDEPLGALDPLIRVELQRDLREVFQLLHKTVVLVTHDLGEAAYLGDWVVLMREGTIVQQGTIREMVDRPLGPFVTEFIHAQRSPLEWLRREGL